MQVKAILKTSYKYLKFLFLAVAIFFLLKYFIEGLQQLKQKDFTINYLQIGISVIFLVIHYNFNSIIWFFITKKTKCEVKLSQTMILWNYSNIAKYIPGRVFSYAARFNYYVKKGASKKNLSLAFYIEFIAGILNSVIFAFFYLIFTKNSFPGEYKPILSILLVSLIIFLHPKIMQFALNIFLKVIKKEPVIIMIKFFDILQIVVLTAANWMVFGFAFMLMLNGFMPISYQYFFLFAGAFSVSSIAGMLAFFTPAGLGVREGVLVALLVKELPKSIATVTSIFSRIWLMFGESVFFILAFSADKIFKLDVWKTIIKQKEELKTDNPGNTIS